MRFLHHLRATEADPYRPYKLMLACDLVIVVGVLISKLNQYPGIEYDHLLVTYRFGFIKRALIGELLSYVLPKVSIAHVYVLGIAVWLATLAAFVSLFKRCFGLRRETLPLFAFMVGSPFFFKNFMHSVGYFDIYGCLAAIVAILLPIRVWYPLALGAGAGLLLLIHHVHFLLYIPTIVVIAVLRYRAQRRVTVAATAMGGAMLAAIVGLFAWISLAGNPTVPLNTFAFALGERANDIIDFGRVRIWYSTLAGEVEETWAKMPTNASRMPVYALFVVLHLPLIRFAANMIRNLPDATDRMLVYASLSVVSAGYLLMSLIVFDHARWVSNWAVCMMLIVHAVRLLDRRNEADIEPLRPTTWSTLAFAWLITLIPRVGITRAF